MSSYFFKNYTTTEFVKSIQQLAEKDKITLSASGKDVLSFNKGSLWALSSKDFYVGGECRFQQIGNDVHCSLLFDRTKIWLVNASMGFVNFVLILTLTIVSNLQALDLNINTALWTGITASALLAVYALIVFGELYLVNKSEHLFRKSFELFYVNLL